MWRLSGLCLGDSGGPLFKTYQTEDGSRMSVLIGIVSRGTGSRGNCGGLDNATHYVRIKKFLDWIMVIYGNSNLGFSCKTFEKEINLIRMIEMMNFRPQVYFSFHVRRTSRRKICVSSNRAQTFQAELVVTKSGKLIPKNFLRNTSRTMKSLVQKLKKISINWIQENEKQIVLS